MLSEQVRVGTLTLKNRLVLAPMATESAADGRVGEEMLAHYRRLAAGFGLAVTEHAYVSPEGRVGKRQLSAADDGDIPGLKRLVEAVHAAGSPVLLQLNHGGFAAKTEMTGLRSFTPSQFPLARRVIHEGRLPKVMLPEDIRRVEGDFVRAALRAKEAGFDGCEIHAAHGYLLNEFYSATVNLRTDDYGVGRLENRSRFAAEVLRQVRAAVGEDFLLSLRFGAYEDREEENRGMKEERDAAEIRDAALAAVIFEEAGADLLDVSGGMTGFSRKGHKEPGWFGDVTAAIRRAVHIPVVLTGGIIEAQAAEKLLAAGKADLIGVGRAAMKDADWAAKALGTQG